MPLATFSTENEAQYATLGYALMMEVRCFDDELLTDCVSSEYPSTRYALR